MTIGQLREAYQARPFKPFTICLADGRKIPVGHPEFLVVTPEATRTFVVATTREAHKVIDLILVTSIDFENGKPRRSAPSGRLRR